MKTTPNDTTPLYTVAGTLGELLGLPREYALKLILEAVAAGAESADAYPKLREALADPDQPAWVRESLRAAYGNARRAGPVAREWVLSALRLTEAELTTAERAALDGVRRLARVPSALDVVLCRTGDRWWQDRVRCALVDVAIEAGVEVIPDEMLRKAVGPSFAVNTAPETSPSDVAAANASFQMGALIIGGTGHGRCGGPIGLQTPPAR